MMTSRQSRVLRQHVRTDALLGADAVPMGAMRAMGEPRRLDAGGEERGANSEEAKPRHVEDSTRRASAGLPAAGWGDAIDRPTRLRVLQALDEGEVRPCVKCELCRGRTQTVFGEGDPEARIMFVGEGPGQTEDETGRPFVGRAGELLDKQIAAMGLKREAVYIANVVKCRPPNNRPPTPMEVEACGGYLRRQIMTIRPEVIITLGGPATKKILNTMEGITKLRGKWASYEGLAPEGPTVPVMPTFHPAFLLRAYTVENRQRVWSDLQQVMAKLGLPAPERASK